MKKETDKKTAANSDNFATKIEQEKKKKQDDDDIEAMFSTKMSPEEGRDSSFAEIHDDFREAKPSSINNRINHRIKKEYEKQGDFHTAATVASMPSEASSAPS